MEMGFKLGHYPGFQCDPDNGRMRAMPEERVFVIEPDVMSGMPCFHGTRVPFQNLIDYLEGGHSLGEFLRQFPAVTR